VCLRYIRLVSRTGRALIRIAVLKSRMDRVPASRARSRLGSLHDRGMVSGATAPSKRLSPGEFTTQPSQKRSMAAASVLVAASEQAVAISGRSAAEVLLAMGWQPSVIKTATEGGRSDTSPTMIEDALVRAEAFLESPALTAGLGAVAHQSGLGFRSTCFQVWTIGVETPF